MGALREDLQSARVGVFIVLMASEVPLVQELEATLLARNPGGRREKETVRYIYGA